MKYIRAIVGVFLLICLDQYTKYMVVQHLTLYDYQPVLGDIFGLYYLENKGMAWGLFQNRQVLFLLFTVVIVAALVYLYGKLSADRRFAPLRVCMLFLTAGAIGNMIDRIFHGETLFQGAVVDFLYIKLINFPVFNVADMYVTLSVAVMLLLLIFRYREDDFQTLFQGASRKQKTEPPESAAETIAGQTEPDSFVTPYDGEPAPTQAEAEQAAASEPDGISRIDQLFSDEEEEDE